MKKSLLFAAALACTAVANAQVFQMNGEDHGLTSEAAEVAQGYQWGAVGDITILNAFTTATKLVDCKNNNYNVVTFANTDQILTKNGVQGSDNPKDADGSNPGISLKEPIQGAVVQINAAADGYCYIVGKLSSNKNYYVFEEGSPIGFTLAMEIKDDRFPANKIAYTAVGEGEYNTLPDNFYTSWPVCVALNDPTATTAGNGLGVIGFEVYEGCQYLVGAGGSKLSWCGVYYTSAPCHVVISGTDEANPMADFELLNENGQAGIACVQNDRKNQTVYNLFGQKSAKQGLCVVNGKKVMY